MKTGNGPHDRVIFLIALLTVVCWATAPSGADGYSGELTPAVHEFALSKTSAAVFEAAEGRSAETLNLIVTYHARPTHSELSRIEALGGTTDRRFELIDALAVKLPAMAVEKLADHPSVAWISLDAAIHSAAKGGKKAGGDSDAITCNSYWYEADFTGYGVTVAVVD